MPLNLVMSTIIWSAVCCGYPFFCFFVWHGFLILFPFSAYACLFKQQMRVLQHNWEESAPILRSRDLCIRFTSLTQISNYPSLYQTHTSNPPPPPPHPKLSIGSVPIKPSDGLPSSPSRHPEVSSTMSLKKTGIPVHSCHVILLRRMSSSLGVDGARPHFSRT